MVVLKVNAVHLSLCVKKNLFFRDFNFTECATVIRYTKRNRRFIAKWFCLCQMKIYTFVLSKNVVYYLIRPSYFSPVSSGESVVERDDVRVEIFFVHLLSKSTPVPNKPFVVADSMYAGTALHVCTSQSLSICSMP